VAAKDKASLSCLDESDQSESTKIEFVIYMKTAKALDRDDRCCPLCTAGPFGSIGSQISEASAGV
jgi:hypothetical protein